MTDNLRVSLWLAERMGLQEAEINGGIIDYVESTVYGMRNYDVFAPFTNPAQLWQVVRWAAMNGVEMTINGARARAGQYCGPRGASVEVVEAGSIDAAVLMAIAKATGWEG